MKSLRAPLLIFALPALALAFAPARHDSLLFQRAALAQGEWWRLWTGHWIHFSGSHAAWNLAVLLGAGAWLEHLRPGWLLRHTLVAAPLLSGILFLAEPNLQVYGGLSGLATSTVVLLGLAQLQRTHAPRLLWGGIVSLVLAKSVYDATYAHAWVVRYGASGIRTSSIAHLGGAALALVLNPVWHSMPNTAFRPLFLFRRDEHRGEERHGRGPQLEPSRSIAPPEFPEGR